VSDAPAAEAALRAANARLREVVGAKDAEIGVLRAEIAAERAARAGLEARLAELERRLGKDSSNSSIPPSADPIAAKAKRGAARSQRERSPDRGRGGQPGHRGSGLEPTGDPDRTERMRCAAACSGCGAGLGDGVGAGSSWVQVWDIPAIRLEKVHYVLPRWRCACCGKTTTTAAPFGAAGQVVYGPNVNAAAILLASQGNVPVQATAQLMAALLSAPVSTGFVARAHERFADRLAAAGFDAAMKSALQGEDVLCGDETPVNVVARDTDEHGRPVPGSPHVVTIRTPDERLVWYAATGSRSKKAIADLGVLDRYTGYLVRDDYAGWHQFDAHLAGVQQCVAHIFRHVQDVLDLHPNWQAWAGEVRAVLRDAHTAVKQAKARGQTRLDPVLLAELRARYDKAVHWGQITNRHRDWHKGNHPGHSLARRLAAKAEQVWLFTTNFAVPWTNNASEQALKSPKLHQKVSGYWHTPATLARFCRVRSYLVSARNHGIRAIDAIHAALTGKTWLPAPTTA
jgi:transposase